MLYRPDNDNPRLSITVIHKLNNMLRRSKPLNQPRQIRGKGPQAVRPMPLLPRMKPFVAPAVQQIRCHANPQPGPVCRMKETPAWGAPQKRASFIK